MQGAAFLEREIRVFHHGGVAGRGCDWINGREGKEHTSL